MTDPSRRAVAPTVPAQPLVPAPPAVPAPPTASGEPTRTRRAASSAFCPLHVSGACHSCPHQDVPLAEQLAAKQERVAGLLKQAVPEQAWLAPVPSLPERFRNKAKMAVSGSADRPVLGLAFPDGTGTDLRTCPLHVSEVEAALPVLAEHAARLRLEPYSIPRRRGELKHVLVTASPDGELMVRWVLRSRRRLADLRASLPDLRRALPALAVASVNIQPVHQAIIEGEEEVVLFPEGDDAVARLLMRLHLPSVAGGAGSEARLGMTAYGSDGLDSLGPGASTTGPAEATTAGRELPLLLPVRSFFQTNTGVAERLYATAAAWTADLEPAAGRSEAVVWDLFCGVGGFALALAGPGRRVLGVEVSAPAIAGARQAAALMGFGPPQARFEAGDARVLDPVGERPDLLVVNPPRRGIGAELAGRVEVAGVGRVLYSSCNPVSLARDLERMPSYRVRRAQLFDMFPHTDHAEVLVDLRRVG